MKLKITVHGVAYEVDVEVLDPGEGFPSATHLPTARPGNLAAGSAAASPPPKTPGSGHKPAPPGTVGGAIASPIGGTIEEISCKPGDKVTEGQILLVIEAMKMKTSIAAPAAGTVKAVKVAVGDTVHESQILVEFE